MQNVERTSDREKIIKGLECCIKRDPDDKTRCGECPYEGACLNRLKLDALALLKAQEPRVITLEELENLQNGVAVFVEFSDGRLLPMLVEDGCLMRRGYLWMICEDAFRGDDYDARCWTSRPTDEQREATPWTT